MNLTRAALALAMANGLDPDDVVDTAREALTRPADAAFWDDDLYRTHTLAFHTPDWSLTDSDIVGQANYRAALASLEPYGATAASVGHWTYSSYQCVKVPVLTPAGNIRPAFVMTCALQRRLSDYPVLDDDLLSELEYDVVTRAIDQSLADYEAYALPDDGYSAISESVRPYLYHVLGERAWEGDPADFWVDNDTIRDALTIAERQLSADLAAAAGQVELEGVRAHV